MLSAAPLDLLRVLWTRAGGKVYDMDDGTLAVHLPNGDRLTRADPATVTDALRVHLAQRDVRSLVPA